MIKREEIKVQEGGRGLGAARLLPEAAPPVAAVPPHLLLLDLHGQSAKRCLAIGSNGKVKAAPVSDHRINIFFTFYV